MYNILFLHSCSYGCPGDFQELRENIAEINENKCSEKKGQ
jgi:hypothetical protein